MNIGNVTFKANGHFLDAYPDFVSSQLVFADYTKDELDLPKSETEGFIPVILARSEDQINSREFARFYTWCYINYVIAEGERWQTLNGIAFPAIHICLDYR